MTAPNIELFNTLVGAIFAHLYEEFPIPTDLSPDTFIAELTVKDETFDGEPCLRREDDEFLLATIQWLGRHGYLHHGSFCSPALVLDCVLTAQALELLSAIPESLESHRSSIGEQLMAASKEGLTEKVKELASDFLSNAVVCGFKAASNWATSS